MFSTIKPLFAAFAIGLALMQAPRPVEHASLSLFGAHARVHAERYGLVATLLPDGRTVRAERRTWPVLGPLSPKTKLWEKDVVAAETDPSRTIRPGDAVGPHSPVARVVRLTPDALIVEFPDAWTELDPRTGVVIGGGVD
jgi:hypothetical protein